MSDLTDQLNSNEREGRDIVVNLELSQTIKILKYDLMENVKQLATKAFSSFSNDFDCFLLDDIEFSKLEGLNAFKTFDHHKTNLVTIYPKTGIASEKTIKIQAENDDFECALRKKYNKSLIELYNQSGDLKYKKREIDSFNSKIYP